MLIVLFPSQRGHILKGVAGIYNRSDYLPEKDAAMVLWLNRLELLINDDDNVSILPRTTDLTRVRLIVVYQSGETLEPLNIAFRIHTRELTDIGMNRISFDGLNPTWANMTLLKSTNR
jgi:hypothetical protein